MDSLEPQLMTPPLPRTATGVVDIGIIDETRIDIPLLLVVGVQSRVQTR